MGQFESANWFIGVTIYFILFIATVTAVSSLGLDFEDGTTSTGSISGLSGDVEIFCSDPRYRYLPNGEYTETYEDNDQCSVSTGAFSSSVCNAIQGCTWSNVTEGFWFFSSTSEACTGDINLTYYDAADDGLCTGLNTSSCQLLGCTLYEYDPLNAEISSPKEIMGTVAELFTFRYDFGFTGLLNTLLSIFLVFIPLLIWILSLYFMLPFLH